MTEPGCQETVTWVIMNRPIYITPSQLNMLRKLVQGQESDPRAPLGGNFRPIQPLNGRTMRTNIFVSSGKVTCPKRRFKSVI
jgi:carbonic anhydrase